MKNKNMPSDYITLDNYFSYLNLMKVL